MALQIAPGPHSSWGEVFRVFLRLGLTSFGGPVAHLGYFRAEFVERRKWLDETAYADIVALCQFLPGPASSQVGMAVGFFAPACGRARGLGGVHGAVGDRAGAVRLWRDRFGDARQRRGCTVSRSSLSRWSRRRCGEWRARCARPGTGDPRGRRGGDRALASRPPGARSARSLLGGLSLGPLLHVNGAGRSRRCRDGEPDNRGCPRSRCSLRC